jgi:DNA-binding response OmpR family regulator
MDQFDKAFEETQEANPNEGPASIILIGDASGSMDSIRASLEVGGHRVTQVCTIASFEEAVIQYEYDLIISTTESKQFNMDQLFELISLLTPNAPVIGFSTSPSPPEIIECVRCGGVDFFCIPEDLEVIADRVQTIVDRSRDTLSSKENVGHITTLCEELNDERHRIIEENDSLCNDMANSHCETQKKMRQVAFGAEFQTLIGQELDVESMLRTALGYMLTRLGATNAAVYLREGEVDWGLGAFINYDRQADQFQQLIDSLGSAICPIMASEKQLKKYTDGETFADFLELDPIDFSGCEVVTFGCFYENKCRAVVALFRGDTRPFDEESIETMDTLRTIFGQQLGVILKIHKRAEIHWPSESIDDDDWSLGKAA